MAGMEERWQNGTMTTICHRKPAGWFHITFQEKLAGHSGGCQNVFSLGSKYINVSV
jgi:hypothetical protein